MTNHPAFPTVSHDDEAETTTPLFKPMDLVEEKSGNSNGEVRIGVVIMGPLSVPYFEDGAGSTYAYTPLDLNNPAEWRQTFRGYVVYDALKQDYKICAEHSLRIFELDPHSGYIPFDLGTGQLRAVLGVIELSKKCGDSFKS